jgi:Domain of unknown function (DUF4836)
MKRLLQLSWLPLVLVVMLTSCSKTPKQVKYIPKDAAYIVAVDTKSLKDKLKSGNIDIDSLIKKYGGDNMDSTAKKMWADFKNAGIDWDDQAFFFMSMKNSVAGGQTFVVNFMASLSDGKKFEDFLKTQPQTKEIKKGTGFSYTAAGSDGVLSWNDKVVIVTMYENNQSGTYDTVTHTWNYPPASAKQASALKEVERLYNQKENESIASVKAFTDLIKEKGDAHIFTSTDGFSSMMSGLPMMMPKLNELMKGNYTTATLNFEDGKIVAKATNYVNDKVAGILKKYAGPTIDMSMLENYPSNNVNVIAAASFKPEIVSGILTELQLEGAADMALGSAGLTTQDLYKCLKGDIAVISSDFSYAVNPTATPGMMAWPMPTAKLIFAAPIGDKASLDKILAKGVATQMLVQNGDTYTLPAGGPGLAFFIKVDAKNIYLTNDAAALQGYIAKTSKTGVSGDVLSKFKGKSTAFYVNAESYLNGISASLVGGGADSIALVKAKATFKDVFATSDNLSGNTSKSEFEFNFKDAKQNSLVSIANFIITIVDAQKAQQDKWRNEANAVMDTTISVKPIK